jgi:hypothetical protein
MYFSSFCFLIPIFFLTLPQYIIISIITLTGSSFTYHNFPNKITKFIDYSNIINLGSNVYFENYYYSFLFIILYVLEFRTLHTHNIKNIVYFLCYSKYCSDKIVNLFFFLSLFVYIIHVVRKEFTVTQRWLWHFGQAMYIYYSLSTHYK